MSNRLILSYLLVLFSVLSYAQPPGPPGGGTGVVGPGEPASPIDGYVYALVLVAILFIVQFARKYRKAI